jgi:predicted chitinase
MNDAIFFASVRSRLFGGALTKPQVDGINAILAEANTRGLADPRQLAYVLATAYHETGRAMAPVREIGKGRGRAYGVADPKTGQTYYGRGYVQITWKTNYERLGRRLGVDLVAAPDRALEPRLAAAILIVGMREGLFTGKTLDDCFDAARSDWSGARRIVNGLDRADEIAAHARAFHVALIAAAAAPAPSVAPPPDASPQPSKEAPLKGYRTLIFNAAVALVGFAQSFDWVEVVGPVSAGWAITAISVANLLLRAATDTPVGNPDAATK